MKMTVTQTITIEDTTPAQAKLMIDILTSEDGHVYLRDYKRKTVQALLNKGVITLLMHRKYGRRDGKMIRLRKDNECQNMNII